MTTLLGPLRRLALSAAVVGALATGAIAPASAASAAAATAVSATSAATAARTGEPGPAVLAPGDAGRDVRVLQARLRQLKLYRVAVDGRYGTRTANAVRRFQKRHDLAVTGRVDALTLHLVRASTRRPTTRELGSGTAGYNRTGRLDARCRTGRVLCIDKTSRTLRWVVDGRVEQTVDVRFGATGTPTREGVFAVQRKSRDHVSTLYDSPMPFAMFFSGGQAVHYSSDFAARGYSGASHGCVNVRDREAVARLFGEVRLGDRVVVYRS